MAISYCLKILRWLLRRGSPLPIPNRVVKPACADGTAVMWESMSSPFFMEPQLFKLGFFFYRSDVFASSVRRPSLPAALLRPFGLRLGSFEKPYFVRTGFFVCKVFGGFIVLSSQYLNIRTGLSAIRPLVVQYLFNNSSQMKEKSIKSLIFIKRLSFGTIKSYNLECSLNCIVCCCTNI